MSNSDSITHIYSYNNESNLVDAQMEKVSTAVHRMAPSTISGCIFTSSRHDNMVLVSTSTSALKPSTVLETTFWLLSDGRSCFILLTVFCSWCLWSGRHWGQTEFPMCWPRTCFSDFSFKFSSLTVSTLAQRSDGKNVHYKCVTADHFQPSWIKTLLNVLRTDESAFEPLLICHGLKRQ